MVEATGSREAAHLRCRRQPALVLIACLILATVATAGCTVTLIAPYDDATVAAATELLKKTDTFLVGIESGKP